MGPVAVSAVPALSNALSDKEAVVRSEAAIALSNMGPAASPAVPALIKVLENDKNVRTIAHAGYALEKLGPAASPAVPALIRTLNNPDATVRSESAIALGSIGAAASPALPSLKKLLVEKQSSKPTIVPYSAADSLVKIFKSLEDRAEIMNFEALEDTLPILRQVVAELERNKKFPEQTKECRRSIKALELIYEARRPKLDRYLVSFAKSHPILVGLGAYLLGVNCFWLLLLWIYPLGILRINDGLRPFSLPLPSWLGGNQVSARTFTLAVVFNYLPRVLDSWVETHSKTCVENFERRETVAQRAVHVAVPVLLDEKVGGELTAETLKPVFENSKTCLLIGGEGGAGKTSLACQIAKWAIALEPHNRLAKHRMLPILIEDELTIGDSGKRLVEAIRGQLQDLADTKEAIPEELLVHLLKQKRILVVLDHFSEMSQESRQEVQPQRPDFPVNALIVTSRLKEELGRVKHHTLQPRRIEGNRLSWFVDTYLRQREARDLFTDAEYFDICRHLSLMVGTRHITILLAKLFIEQMIARQQGTGGTELPENIPDLMLRYLNEVNRTITQQQMHDREVQRAVRTVSWLCLQRRFVPSSSQRDEVLVALGNTNAHEQLTYLEEKLKVVQTVGESRDHVRIVLDPLSEYLAALEVLATKGADETAWRDFMSESDRIRQNNADGSQASFLLALRDCVLAKGDVHSTPLWVAGELQSRA